MSERVAVFAEAFLHTSNGKAAHGLIRYGEREVVAVVDSLHAGQLVERGRAVRAPSRCRSSRRSPRRRRAGRSASPSAWRRRAASCRPSGRPRCSRRSRSACTSRPGLHDELGRDPDLVAAAAARGLELRDIRRVPAGLSTPSGAGLGVPARIVHTVGTRLRDRQDDRHARAHRRRAGGRRARRVRADRARSASRSRAGASPSTTSSPTTSRAPPSGSCSRAPSAATCCSSRGRARSCTRSTPASRSACCTAATPHALVLVHEAGAERIDLEDRGGPPGPLIPPLRELADLLLRLTSPLRPAPVVAIALSTRPIASDERGARGDRGRRGRDRPRLRRPRALRRRAPVARRRARRSHDRSAPRPLRAADLRALARHRRVAPPAHLHAARRRGRWRSRRRARRGAAARA